MTTTPPTWPTPHAWMSWWDKYLAPGDLRAQQKLSPTAREASNEARPIPTPPAPRIDAAQRSRRQNGLFFGGLAFTALSALITRRALLKKRLATYPGLARDSKLAVPHFTQSNTQAKAEGGLDAAEALFIATLSVGSVFMAGAGAFMKVFDIADIEDLRGFVRSGVGYDVYGGSSEADKELEEWAQEVLSQKDGVGNLQESIVQKLADLGELEKRRKEEAELAVVGKRDARR